MKARWKKLFVKTMVWLATEIILNLAGLDNLADYSEFIYEQQVTALSQLPQPTTVIVA